MNNLLNNPVLEVLIALVIVVYIVYRQLRERKLSARGLIIFPAILLILIAHSWPSFHPSSTKALEILISAIVSTTLGLLACRQLRVYAGPTGQAMAKGSWTYFLWWLGALIIKSILSVAFGETQIANVSEVEFFIPIFILITTRNVYLYWRTAKLGLPLH